MLLHTLATTDQHRAFSECRRIATNGDAILLIGDGAYCANTTNGACEQLINTRATLYVLEEDARARGVCVDERVTAIDMSGFVELTERYARMQAWY